MVETRQLIKILISIDTIISFEGIIPSYSALKNHLLRLLNLLRKALENEGVTDTQAEQLIWLIAIWLDRTILTHRNQTLSGRNDDSLEFSLFRRISNASEFAVRLTALLHEASEPVVHYARQIGQLYSDHPASDEALVAALARFPVHPVARDRTQPERQHSPRQLALPAGADKTSAALRRPVRISILYWLMGVLITLWVASIICVERSG